MDKKRFDNDTALAKLKAIISSFYENLGREMIEDIDIERKQLMEDIDDILNSTEISQKHFIIEKLNLDKELKQFVEEKINKKDE